MSPKNIKILAVVLFAIFVVYLLTRETYDRCLNEIKKCKTDSCVFTIRNLCDQKYGRNWYFYNQWRGRP
jgi:hypothetical protein